jgi:hypothetical protein
LFCGYGVKDKIIDPRKLSSFIEDVMDPYGRQDKLKKDEEKKLLKEKHDRERSEKESEKTKNKHHKFKKVWEEIQKTKNLLKDNISLTEKLYEKMEKGEVNNSDSEDESRGLFILKKIPQVIKLFGAHHKKELNINNIKLLVNEITEFDSDNEDKKSRNNSDSDDSLMDFDVCHDASIKNLEYINGSNPSNNTDTSNNQITTVVSSNTVLALTN